MARANTQRFDGLTVGYGTHTLDDNVFGQYAGTSIRKQASMEIVGTKLELTTITSASFPPQAIQVKRGSKILSATFVVTEAFSTGSSPTLTIGTYKYDSSDGTVTADDADGIDATIAATAIDAIGEVVNCDGALVGTAGTYNASAAGTLAGSTSDSDVVVGAFAGTAAFTTGKGILTLEWIEPQYNASAAF